MRDAEDRNIRILGYVWLILACIAFARGLFVTSQRIIDPPSAPKDWADRSMGFPIVGIIHVATGRAILLRKRRIRPFLMVSSAVLGFLYLGGVFGERDFGAVPPLIVMVASLWLTLSRRGRRDLEGYLSKPSV